MIWVLLIVLGCACVYIDERDKHKKRARRSNAITITYTPPKKTVDPAAIYAAADAIAETAIALERQAEKTSDPVKRARLQEAAAKKYLQCEKLTYKLQ